MVGARMKSAIEFQTVGHTRSQYFVWGALFSLKKLTTFLVVALKRRSKTTKSL